MAALDGLQRPSLDALLPRLVERDELPAAAALSSLRGTFGMILGPATGGLLIATIGLPATFGVDLVTFAVSLGCLLLMRAVPPPPDAEPPSLRGVVEGFRYAMSRPELVGTYGVDIIAMFFGMPNALFPAFAEKLGGPGVLGLLYAAPSFGAMLASLTSGWTGRVHRHGLAVLVAAAGWGVGIVVCGLATSVSVACAGLVVAGFADMLSGIFRSTIWNQTIPDRLRGRLAGIEQLSYSTGPLLGNVESGVVAAFVGRACVDRLRRPALHRRSRGRGDRPAGLQALRRAGARARARARAGLAGTQDRATMRRHTYGGALVSTWAIHPVELQAEVSGRPR